MKKFRSLVVFMLTFFMGICLFACAKTGNYKFSRIEWKEDGTGATVILVDESDSSKQKEVLVDVTLKEKKDATCEEKEKRVYTVTYEGETYTKEFLIGEPLGHNYEFEKFEWAEDLKTANAVLVCQRDNKHTKKVAATMTSVVTTPATCEANGVVTYTATYETHTESKDVETPALEHNYQFDHFAWSEDSKSAKAVLICQNDTTHTSEVEATMTSVVKTPATCEEKGVTTYTATYETHTESKDVETPALEHNYQFDHFAWSEDSKSAKAVLICQNDTTHTSEVEATVTSVVKTPATCEEKGVTAYTATYGNNTESKDVSDINKLEHNYQFDHFAWSEDFKTAKAVLVCQNDNNHVKEENASMGVETFENYTKYTATYGDNVEAKDVSNNEEVYVINFINVNDEIISSTIYKKGEDVVVPTAAFDDETYTYTFKAWDKEVSLKALSSASYKALYDKEYKEYEIIFVDYNDNEISKKKYHYDTEVTVPTDPTREADNTYTYEFKGWTPEITKVDGAKTYKAEYTATYIEYEIIFVDYNDNEISKKKYHYDTEVTVPTNPTREADNTYTYEFKGWTPEVTKVDGAKTYKAEYTATYIEYEIIFENYDHEEISKAKYHYGDDIVFPTENPIHEADFKYTYLFAGWNQMPTVCMGNRVYTAMYRPVYIEYEIKFVDYDDTEISKKNYHYDDVVVAPEDPTRKADSTYTYAFDGWDKEVTKVKEATTYKATYKEEYIIYTVIYLNYDGTEITTKEYHYGDDTQLKDKPTRPADETYTYVFNGWDVSIDDEVTTTCTAKYTPVYIEYEIKFVDYDDTEISKKNYHYDDVVVAPEDPTRKADSTYTYAFDGWDKEITKVEGTTTYKATYKETYIIYTITYLNYDGTKIASFEYHYGEAKLLDEDPTRQADNTYTYEFNGWETKIEGLVTTLTAKYRPVYIDYVVKFMDGDKTVSEAKYHYNDTLEVPDNPKNYRTDTTYYEFDGWDKDVSEKVTESVTYNAEYIEHTRQEHDVKLYSDLNYVYTDDEIYEPAFSIFDGENYTLKYSIKGEDNFTTEAPSELGEYTLKIIVPESDYYLETVKTYDLVIAYKNNTFINIDAYDSPNLLVEFDKFGKLIKAVGRSDLGYKFIDDYDIDGITPKGLIELYNEVLLAENYDKLAAYFKEYNGFFDISVVVTNQPKGTNYIEAEIKEAISNFKYPACDYDVHSVDLNKYYLAADINVLGTNNIDDIEERLDDIIDTLSLTNSYEIGEYYFNSLKFHILNTVTDYYISLLEQIDSEDAKAYAGAIDGYRNSQLSKYLVDYGNYYLTPYYTALLVQYNDSLYALKNLVAYCNCKNDIDYFATRYDKSSKTLNNYNPGQDNIHVLCDIYERNIGAFYDSITTDAELLELISNLYDENDLLAAVKLAFSNARKEMLGLVKAGNAQNVYYLDQRIIVGTNKYYYADEYADVTYLFNEYNFNDQKYYLGYIIDGAYSKEGALDSSVEKHVLDIFSYEDKNGYIDYINYKGITDFDFNFKENKFETCEGELVHIAYYYDLDGRAYTVRLNKNKDKLISYVYYGHWTPEEIIKRVSEPCDDHFGEDSLWYYEGEFIIVETEGGKLKYYVDPDDKYVLKEYILEYYYDDLDIFAYYGDTNYILAFVTIIDKNYVFYYPADTLYSDIEAGLATPILGLNGTITWEIDKDEDFLTVSNDDYVYLFENGGLVKAPADETYYEYEKYEFEDGNDKYELIFNVRFNYQEYHYVKKNGSLISYSWKDSETAVVVMDDFEIKYMFTKTDNGLVELDYADATKVILYSGFDLNEEIYVVIYSLNGITAFNVYDEFINSVEDTFASTPNGKYTIVNFKDDIFTLRINEKYKYFEINGNKINEVAPENYEIVTLKNYDGTDFYYIVAYKKTTIEFDDVPTPTMPYDDVYYYRFEGWEEDFTAEERTFVAQYGMLMRTITVITTNGHIDYAYDGKEVSMPTYHTNSDGKAAMYYKLIDADDDAYTPGMPKEVGRYYVKLVIEGTEHYLENYSLIELDIELPTKQYVMFHYLTYINLLVDETGYVVDTNTLDQVLNPILEEACVIGLPIDEATKELVDAYNKLGLFALKTESTKDNSDIKFGAQVFSCGEYAEYFTNIIKNSADEELAKLNLANDFECLMNQYDVKERHLPYFTLFTEGEIAALSDYQAIKYFLDNTLLTEYYSYGFNEYVVNLEPIYTLYYELDQILDALKGYDSDSEDYVNLKAEVDSAVEFLNGLMANVNTTVDTILKNDSLYFFIRNDFYNALNTYMEAYQNNDKVILQIMPADGILELFNEMMNCDGIKTLTDASDTGLFGAPTVAARYIRESIYGSNDKVTLIEDALSNSNQSLGTIRADALDAYVNYYIDIVKLSYDYDLEEMPIDVNLAKNNGVAEYYLINDLTDETWIFVDLSAYDALKNTEYDQICYVYDGQFTLDQYNYIDAKLLRFFRYFKDEWDNAEQCYPIEISDLANPFELTLKAPKDNKEIPMPELGRGELEYVAHMELLNKPMTFGLFNDDGDKVAFIYYGTYSFDDVFNGRVSMPDDSIFSWSEKDGMVTIVMDLFVYIFVEDENEPDTLVERSLEMKDIELKYAISNKDTEMLFAFIVVDGNNYVVAYLGNPTKEEIEAGKCDIVIGNGGAITWELVNDNALVAYYGEDVYSAHYVTYDEQNKEYKYEIIGRYDLRSYDVAYTYTNDTYSYLLLNGLSYYGNTFHDAYRFDGVLTLEEMLESFGKPNDSKHYMWSEYDNSVVLDNQGKVVKVFIKNDGKLQEVEEKSEQIVTLNYSVTLYLIVDELGIVTDVYGEDEYSNYFLANHDLVDIYLKDAIIEFLKGLDEDGYFILAKDILEQQKDRYFDTVKISSTIENNMTADIEAVMKTIRDDINISWSVFDPRSNLTAISINKDVSKMTLEEATKELIHRYEIASKYTTAGFKYFALYYKDIYEFVSLLNSYKTALTAMTKDSSDKYATALTKVEDALKSINNYKTDDGWAYYVYLTFLSAASPYLYERNEIYNDIIALLESIQNDNEYEIHAADYDKIFDDNFAQQQFREQMVQLSNYLGSVYAIKTNLYDDLGLDIINDIYSYMSTNGGMTSILSNIEKAYINELDIYASIADFNVLESNADFILRFNDVYVVEYIYHDGYANETWVFAKWKDNEPTSFYDEYNDVYSICYVFDGLYDKTELTSGSINREILRFAKYYAYPSENELKVSGPYISDDIEFIIDENDELSLIKPEGELDYVAYFDYMGAVFTFGFYDSGEAYQYYGEYSYKELNSGRVRVWNAGYNWEYYDKADLYTITAPGTEVIFYLDEDGYLYEYKIDFSDINIVYSFLFESTTFVFTKDEDDNQYAYVFANDVTEADIKAGNAKLAMGGMNNLGWYGDENCIVITEDGEVFTIFLYDDSEEEYTMHDPDEVIDGYYCYSIINDKYSLLFTKVETILGEEKYNVYEYSAGIELEYMLNDYKKEWPSYKYVYGRKETETDIFVYDYLDKQIIMKFTKGDDGLKNFEIKSTRVYEYIYFDENDNTYACYYVNGFPICYFFDREVLYTELDSNLDNYTAECLWSIDKYGRITLADFKNYFKLASMYGSALEEIVPLEFNEDPTIDYVLYDKEYNGTYILFEADGNNYTYVYEGNVTSKEFGKVEPVRGIAGEYGWYLEDNKISIINGSNVCKIAVYKNDQYVLVSFDDIESYEIKYIYVGEKYQYVFVEAVTYGKQPKYNVLSKPLDLTVEEIELSLYDYYNPDETAGSGMIISIYLTWVESDSSIAVIKNQKNKATVISAKYLKQEDSIYLTDYEVKTQEYKYCYIEATDYIYALYVENGLYICYSYAVEDTAYENVIASYCWHEHKLWGSVIIVIDAFTEGEYFMVYENQKNLYIAGKNSGGTAPIVTPISGGGSMPISGNPKSPIMA